jgi:hypothetical protein
MTNTAGFKSGHQKLGGRKRGTPNRSNLFDQRAVLRAAHLVGFDLNGKDGLVGYFMWVALSHPRAFLTLALRIMDIQEGPQSLVAQPSQTTEQLLQEIEEFLGPDSEHDNKDAYEASPDVPWSWTGRGFPLGQLIHMAALNPAAYCKMLAAFLPAPRGKSRRRAAAYPDWLGVWPSGKDQGQSEGISASD